MAGTSPSINDNNDIAFQSSNGDLWIWLAPASGVGSGAHDLRLGMKAGTSPSISKDPGVIGAARPQTSRIGGPGNDRLNGRFRNDLIYGARGNYLIRGARATTTSTAGPASTVSSAAGAATSSTAAPATMSSTAGLATTASTARPATTGSSTTVAPRLYTQEREPTRPTGSTDSPRSTSDLHQSDDRGIRRVSRIHCAAFSHRVQFLRRRVRLQAPSQS
jgi:hypothetical protein